MSEKLGFIEVKQLLVIGPSGRYYVVVGDEGVRALQSLLSDQFYILNLFAVDKYEEDIVSVPNIIHFHETYSVNVEPGTDCDSSEDDVDDNFLSSEEDDREERLEVFKKQRRLGITEKLEEYKVLEKGMSFKDLAEAKQVIDLYVVANKKGLQVKKK